MKTFILTMVLFIATTYAFEIDGTDITSIIEDCGRVYLFLLKTCHSNFKYEIWILLGSTGAKIGSLWLEGQCDVSNPLGCVARKGTSIKGFLSFTGDEFSEQILFQNKYSYFCTIIVAISSQL